MESNWHLAQINIGRIRGINIEDPIMSDFVRQLDEINSLAEGSDGFIWRLKEESNNATGLHPYADERIIVNMSVWNSIEELEDFTFKGRHADVLRQRRSWFEKMEQLVSVLWYIPSGHTPTIDEAKERLKYLNDHGSTEHAFEFKSRFPKPQ